MKLILDLLIIIHIGIWIFILFGGYFKESYAKLNILIFIPLIYIAHILPFHMILETKLRIIENESIHNNNNTQNNISSKEVLINEESKYIIPYYFKLLKDKLENSFANPLSPQGLLILGNIINVYLMIYKWKTWKN